MLTARIRKENVSILGNIASYLRVRACECQVQLKLYRMCNLIQKHPECKKRSGQELKKDQDEKELKSKWVAKAGVVFVLMRIKF